MFKRKTLRKNTQRFIGCLLAFTVTCTLLTATLFAAEPTLPLMWFAGNKVTDANKGNLLGDGTASLMYEESTSQWIITLNNATINTTGLSSGISVSDSKLNFELRLIGTNTISSKDICIFLGGSNLKITGPGTLELSSSNETTMTTNGKVDDGIQYGNITILDVPSLKANGYYRAINCGANLTIQNSTADLSCTATGNSIVAFLETCSIIDSHVTAKSVGETNEGIYSFQYNSKINIKNSTVAVESDLTSLFSKESISISNSDINTSSQAESSIFTVGELNIVNNSKVVTSSKYCGLQANGAKGMTINDSEIDALSSSDIAIFSRGSINIADSKVHANGEFGALAARSIQTASEPAISKINVNSLVEKNGGKVAFSDWYAHSGGKDTRSWTSFITQSDSVLTIKDNTNMLNPLKEIWLGKTVCDFGHNYDTEYTIDKIATCSQEGSKSIHCSNCNEVKDIVTIAKNPHVESEWAVITPPTLTMEGSQQKTCTVCKEVLETTAIAKLPSKDIVVDSMTGTSVEYTDNQLFDKSIELLVTPQEKGSLLKHNLSLNKLTKGSIISELYDVKLLKDGVAIQPSGNVKVTLKLTEQMKAMTELQVIYIDNNDKISIIPSEVKEDEISFVTNHLSYYGIVGNPKQMIEPPKKEESNNKKPETNDNSSVFLWVNITFISAYMIFITNKKKENV